MSPEQGIEVLKQGNFMRFITRGGWECVQRTNCSDIVMIFAMTPDAKVVLIEQFRPPVDSKVIEFPAGLSGDLEGFEEEDVREAAKRELFEETGFEGEEFEIIMESPTACGNSADRFTIVRAHNIRKTGPGGGLEEEDIVVHEVPLAEIDAWLKARQDDGILVDSKIYAGLYFLKQYNTLS